MNKLPDSNQLINKMRSALESSIDGIALLNPEGVYYYLNPVHVSLFGYEKEEELLGKTWQFIYGEEEINRINSEIFPLLMRDGKWKGETIGKSKTGEKVFQEITLTITEDGGIICICRDISERLRNQQQLFVNNNILQETKSIIIVTNTNREIEWVNESFCKTTGYTFEEVKGKNPGKLLQGEKSDADVIKAFKNAMEKSQPFNCELLNYKKDGATYWVEIKCQPLKNEAGEIVSYFAVEEDITDRKNKEQLLSENQIRLEMAIEGAEGALWDWDIMNQSVYYSITWKKMLGYDDNEISNSLNEWSSRIHPEEKELVLQQINNYLTGNSGLYENELRLLHKKGHYITVIDRGKITNRDSSGNPSRMIGIAFNISRYTEVRKKLYENETRWNAALKGSSFGVWDWDLTNNTLYFSSKLKQLYGYNDEELTPSVDFWIATSHPDDLEETKQALAYHLDNQTTIFQKDRRILHRDGSYRWFFSSGVVLERGKLGEPLRIVGSVADITERKKLEQDLINAKDIAEKNVKKQRRFLANISHEIRTPLHAIMGITEQLCNSPLNEVQKNQLSIINDSVKSLSGIINDVIDISKIEEGKLNLVRFPFSLKETAENVFGVFKNNAENKKLQYELHFDESLNTYFSGDEGRIRQVLMNILSNAVKFTENGSVRIFFSLVTQKDDTVIIGIDCIDTGIGMSHEMKQKLFKDFTQEDDSFNRKYGGSGLGLSITYELVKLMNGTINISSEKSLGTTVHIVVPLEIAATGGVDTTIAIRTQEDIKKLQNIRILAAEDNSFNQLLLQYIFENKKIKFDMVENGRLAIEMAAAHSYDIILMDIQMPEMNGLEATRNIRETISSTIPIIAITANAVKEELEQYINDGFTDYITKPFDEEKLIKKIADHVLYQPAGEKIITNSQS